MTRRERLERRLENRKAWAEKAHARSDARLSTVSKIADNIPLGQPILVGHHSEAHARRDAERIDNGIRKAVEEDRLASHHEARASGLESALESTIFSDDSDAVEKIEERIAENVQKREQMKRINKLYAKGDAPGLAALGLDLEKLRASVAGNFSWDKRPYASYSLTNLGARIRADKKRVEEIKKRKAWTDRAESAGGLTIDRVKATGKAFVTFSEKPAREIIDAMKAAGFFWCGANWYGNEDKIPACVLELQSAKEHGRASEQ